MSFLAEAEAEAESRRVLLKARAGMIGVGVFWVELPSVGEDEKFLKMSVGDGCTMGMHLLPPANHLKIV